MLFRLKTIAFISLLLLYNPNYPTFLTAETAELSKDPENFQNPSEGKEQGDLVDYSWANIGSFDDLDRIFR